MMQKTVSELLNSKNNGWAFEAHQALENEYRRRGGLGQTDLLNEHKRIECKFFTIKPATKGKNAVYNSAHGFEANKTQPLLEQLKRYCAKADRFLIGVGPTPDDCFVFELSRSEAYEFFAARLQYSATYGIRFCWSGNESRREGRYNTLRKNGYII